jgi:hypothetical protein
VRKTLQTLQKQGMIQCEPDRQEKVGEKLHQSCIVGFRWKSTRTQKNTSGTWPFVNILDLFSRTWAVNAWYGYHNSRSSLDCHSENSFLDQMMMFENINV